MTAEHGAARDNGFTLVEVLIVVAIVAILAAVGYPQYTEYGKKTRRAEIVALLVEEAQRLERFHTRSGQYADAQGPPAQEHEVAAGNDFYLIQAQRSQRTFVLTATPIAGTTMGSDKCGGFVLSNTGRRDSFGMSGDASVQRCWGR